ncbi:MAG: hypothetical protein ACX931_13210 [Saccharospirillum sp.]
MNWLDLYGYLGSALIAISLMMSNIRKLRWINLIGAGTFASYGVLIQAWPVAALNGFIVLINVVHLWQIHRRPATRHDIQFRVSDRYVQSVLSQTLPQVMSLDEDTCISVRFRGGQPVDFHTVERCDPVSESRLAA